MYKQLKVQGDKSLEIHYKKFKNNLCNVIKQAEKKYYNSTSTQHIFYYTDMCIYIHMCIIYYISILHPAYTAYKSVHNHIII